MSAAGGKFISDKFKTISKNLNIEQAVSSSEQQKSRGMSHIPQADTQKCFDNISNPHIALL